MPRQLPSFDQLLKMAKEDPEQLDQLQKEMCEELIRNAPADYQRKLRGTQFKIDMERRRARSPIASCKKISEMMQDSFSELRDALGEVQNIKTPQVKSALNQSVVNKAEETTETECASVIQFPPNS